VLSPAPPLTVVPDDAPPPQRAAEPEPDPGPESEPEPLPEAGPPPAAPALDAATPPRVAGARTGRFESASARADPLRDIGALDLDHLSAIIAQVLAVAMVAILVRAPDDPDTLIAAGEHGVNLRGRRWPTDAGLAGMVIARGERVAVNDYSELGRRLGGEQSQDVHTAAAAPLVTRSGLRGGVSIGSRSRTRRIEVSDLELLSALTELVAAGMDNPPETEWPDEGARAQVEGLVSAMDARDPDERRRTTMLVAMADRVGARMLGGDLRARAELTLAARLHDVGMLRVPVTPLKRPGPLVGGVERLVASHPAWGADLISAIPGLQCVAAYVRFHQERWDGSGYPHGLAGERIPLQSRIVSVCEAWASMVIGRPHAPARTPEHAVEELRKTAGSQFDPAVIEVVVSVSRTMPRPMPRVVSE
jgi:HD-GYP domain-containing protein (c-di-GMP phosphodiesterase class II)